MSIDNFDVIRSPILTEKATDLRDDLNQVAFKIDRRANKRQVLVAIEKIFGVKVEKVRIINVPEKPKRLGKSAGTRSGYKKAIVSVKAGDKIEIFEKVE